MHKQYKLCNLCNILLIRQFRVTQLGSSQPSASQISRVLKAREMAGDWNSHQKSVDDQEALRRQTKCVYRRTKRKAQEVCIARNHPNLVSIQVHVPVEGYSSQNIVYMYMYVPCCWIDKNLW